MMAIDAGTIYFDIGDTLYFSEEMEKEYPKRLLKLISERHGVSTQEAKDKLQASSESLEGKIPHVTKVAAMDALGFTRAEVHTAFCSVDPKQYLKPDPALDSFLQGLSKNFTLGIISNFKRSHALEIFSALGITESVFTHFVTEDIVTHIKPHAEPFEKATALSGMDAFNCIYVADSISKDLRPAKEAGMKTVWVTSKELKEGQGRWVDGKIRSVLELCTLL